MKKVFSLFCIGLISVFSMSFITKKQINLNPDFYERNNYVKVIGEEDIFYIADGELQENIDNIVIDNYNEYNNKKDEYYIHLDSKNDRYTFLIDDFDETKINFTSLSYNDFLKDDLLLSRYNYKNKVSLNKEVGSLPSNYLDINTGNSDYFIDFYSPTYYSTIDIVRKVDDPILELIPKNYFHSEGEEMFFGQEYAYYIRTVKYTGVEKGLKYKSIVTVFDIEYAPFIYDTKMKKKPVDLISGASPKYYSYFAFNQKFSCYYNTYYRNMMTEYDWNTNYLFSDSLYTITLNSGNKFYSKDELMPLNFKYSICFDSFTEEFSSVNNDMKDVIEAVAATTFLGNTNYPDLSGLDFLINAKFLKVNSAKGRAIIAGIKTAISAIDKLYEYFIEERKNDRSEDIANMLAGCGNLSLIGNEFSDFKNEYYKFLDRTENYIPVTVSVLNTMKENKNYNSGIMIDANINLESLNKNKYTSTYNIVEFVLNSSQLQDLHLNIKYGFDMYINGKKRTFTQNYISHDSRLSQIPDPNDKEKEIPPRYNLSTRTEELNKHVSFIYLDVIDDSEYYIEAFDSQNNHIELYLYDSIQNQIAYRLDEHVNSIVNIRGKPGQVLKLVLVNKNNSTYNYRIKKLDKINSSGQDLQLSLKPSFDETSQLKIYEISSDFQKYIISTTGNSNPKLLITNVAFKPYAYNDDAYFDPNEDYSDYNAYINYSKNIVNAQEKMYLIVIDNYYSNDISSLTVNFYLYRRQ